MADLSGGSSPEPAITSHSDVSTIVDIQAEPVPFDIRNISGTDNWIADHEAYLEWIRKDHSILWIKSEAGVGKSVLMHFLQSKARLQTGGGERTLVVSCGNKHERTPLDLYRSLIWKLFDEAPDVPQNLDVLNREWLHTVEEKGWQIQVIQDMLMSAVGLLGTRGLQLYIDSFTNFEATDAVDMIAFLNSLLQKAQNENARLHICFASQHLQNIAIPHCVNLSIESESGHSQDIIHYINSMLSIGDSEQASKIGSNILKRCSGIFLWATLVVSMLNRAYARGENDIEKCHAMVRETPSNIDEVIETILWEDQESQDEFRRSIQWALFANEPLTLSEYYDAVHGMDIEGPDLNEELLLRFLHKSSRGLLKLSTIQKSATILFRRGRGTSETTVEFVHELVHDYFLNKGGVDKLWPDLQVSFNGTSHAMLRSRCEDKIQQFGDILEHKAFHSILWKHPFLDYAIGNVIRHSNSAQKHGIAQEDFMCNFPWLTWSSIANKINYYRLRFSEAPSTLYMLATQDAGELITAYQHDTMDFKMDDQEEYRHPLIAAVVCESYSAISALCSTVLLELRDVSSAKEYALLWKGRKYDYTSDKDFPILVFLAEFGHVPLMKAFLARHGDQVTEVLARERRRRPSFSSLPMLQFVLQKDQHPKLPEFGRHIGMYDLESASSPELVEALIKKRLADIDWKDLNHSTVLHYASGRGHRDIVEALLNNGANASAANLGGSTPLMFASKAGIVEVLIRHGADLNARDHRGRTALFGRKSPSLIDILLQHGADPNVRDKEGKVPLHELASGGISYDVPSPYPKSDKGEVPKYFKMPTSLINMKLLIRYGADVNARDSSGQSPLNYARDPELIDLLQSSGAKSYPRQVQENNLLQKSSNRKTTAQSSQRGGLCNAKCQIL